MKRLIPATLLSVALLPLTLAGAAIASPDRMSDADEVRAMQSSGMTLAEAITRAEAEAGGTAVSADWDRNDATRSWGYEVDIADAGAATLRSFFVNPADGTITQTEMEQIDQHPDDD